MGKEKDDRNKTAEKPQQPSDTTNEPDGAKAPAKLLDRRARKGNRRKRRRSASKPRPGVEIEKAKRIAALAAQVVLKFDPALERNEVLAVVAEFKKYIVPKRKPGRPRNTRITAACADYKAGIRGLALHRAHIAGFDKLSRWQRQGKIRRLTEAIRTRLRRERASENDEVGSKALS